MGQGFVCTTAVPWETPNADPAVLLRAIQSVWLPLIQYSFITSSKSIGCDMAPPGSPKGWLSRHVLHAIAQRMFCLTIAAPVPCEQLLSAVLLLCFVSLRSFASAT